LHAKARCQREKDDEGERAQLIGGLPNAPPPKARDRDGQQDQIASEGEVDRRQVAR
jgi:hypothetical protein